MPILRHEGATGRPRIDPMSPNGIFSRLKSRLPAVMMILNSA
jgi:hypothetical protein